MIDRQVALTVNLPAEAIRCGDRNSGSLYDWLRQRREELPSVRGEAQILGMLRNEAQTRFELIDPALDVRGWPRSAIKVEERDAAMEIIDGKARRRATKPKDYVFYWGCSGGTYPQPIGILEAKRERLPPDYELEQEKNDRKGKLRHVPTVLSTNGHLTARLADLDRLPAELLREAFAG